MPCRHRPGLVFYLRTHVHCFYSTCSRRLLATFEQRFQWQKRNTLSELRDQGPQPSARKAAKGIIRTELQNHLQYSNSQHPFRQWNSRACPNICGRVERRSRTSAATLEQSNRRRTPQEECRTRIDRSQEIAALPWHLRVVHVLEGPGALIKARVDDIQDAWEAASGQRCGLTIGL